MGKQAVMFGAVLGLIVGAFVPSLWGDTNTFGVSSLLFSMIGGFAGIYAVVWLSKRIG